MSGDPASTGTSGGAAPTPTPSPSTAPSHVTSCEPRERDQSIGDRFEHEVRAHGDRIAVHGRTRTWTYRGLNEMANRLARTVLANPPADGQTVTLLLEKDGPLAAGILGVLKAGHIFVALDPTHAGARATQIVDDAHAWLIVTDAANDAAAQLLANGARSAAGRPIVIRIDELDAGLSGSDVGLNLPSDTLAYVTYTSGSSGEPKGVVQNHRNVLHNVTNHTNNLQLTADDRLTLLASCSTAQAMTDIFCALLNGACLYPFDIKAEGLTRLASWLDEERITVYHSSASIFRHFVDSAAEHGGYQHLRIIKLGSEQVFHTDVQSFRRHFPGTCRLVNALSSSEALTLRHMVVDADMATDRGVVPVGFPVDGVTVLLLDDDGQPAAAGAPGEIVIESLYLAPGYWRRPDLTQAVFVTAPDGSPFRRYRSGDLGRMTADGRLEYLGRKDDQVKIRGFRVEVAEVEAALLALVTVRHAAVVARQDRPGDRQLVAYVVAAPGTELAAPSLRTALRARLPEHMVPSVFVAMDALPLTPSGKVDRRALPAAAPAQTARDRLHVPARSPLESQLVQTFEDLLGIRPIGVHDDFFELGGHSLLAVRLMDRIEQACGRRLSLATLFDGATVEHLAAALLAGDAEQFRSPLVAIQPHGTKPALFFLHGDYNGGGFYCRNLARRLGSDQPFFALLPHGLDGHAIPDTIEAMAADRLRTLLEFQQSGPYLLGGYCNGGLVAYEMARRLEQQGHRVTVVAIIDASTLNVGFRWLRHVVSGIGFVLRLDHDQQGDWFKTLRAFISRFGELSHDGRRAQASFVVDRVRQVLPRLKRRLKQRVGATRPPEVGAASAPAAGSPELAYRTADRVYRAIIERYTPGPFGGRVAFLRSHTMRWRSPVDPTAGWSRLARTVDVHWVPGGHLSCLTTHLDALAEHLASCLTMSGAEGADREEPRQGVVAS